MFTLHKPPREAEARSNATSSFSLDPKIDTRKVQGMWGHGLLLEGIQTRLKSYCDLVRKSSGSEEGQGFSFSAK